MKTGPRNRQGVKDASDCWRTIKGRRYLAYMSFPSAEKINAMRRAGIRVRKFGDELFVLEDDKERAAEFEALTGRPV